jgi:hypothetical protein
MTRQKWKNRIIKAMTDVGTYQESFDDVIDTLSGILERRDILEKQFKESGQEIIVEHINKAGATNLEQNPTIRLLNDMNRDALTFWRDLGLTPKGLKAINDMAIKEDKSDPLDEIMKKLGRDLS